MLKKLKLSLIFLVIFFMACYQLEAQTENTAEIQEAGTELTSEQTKDIDNLIKQISDQKDPSVLREVGKELALIFGVPILLILPSLATGSHKYTINLNILIIWLFFGNPVINIIRILNTALSNKTPKTLNQIKWLACDQDLSKEEIQALIMKLNAAEAKILQTKKPLIARIVRAVGTCATATYLANIICDDSIYDGWTEIPQAYMENLTLVLFIYALHLIPVAILEIMEYNNRESNIKKIRDIINLLA